MARASVWLRQQSSFHRFLNHVRSISCSARRNTTRIDNTVPTDEGSIAENITQDPPGMFPRRLLKILHGEGADGGREGVGGVKERERIAARTDLLKALVSTESQLLSPEKTVSIFCRHYQDLRGDMERRQALISVLASDLAVNHTLVHDAANQLTQLHKEGRSEATLLKSESNLRHVLTPFYTDLYTRIARMDGGIKFLVNLRADILDQIKSAGDPASTYLLSEMDHRLRDLLKLWFSSGLLDIQQLTWESPCDIMEKVGESEVVHRLRHWQDLKHRVSHYRRCFVFTHRSLPREPLVILHVALTSDPPSNVRTLLNRSLQSPAGDISGITTATFYSITATQKGLSGIHLGFFLIRRAINEILKEFPGQLTTFVTLSPVPGFRRWLDSHVRQALLPGREGEMPDLRELQRLFPNADSSTEALQMVLANRDWVIDKEGPLAAALKQPLLALCARYLVDEKRRHRALDPVADFHLNAGARVWRLNWLADVSPAGLQKSYGIMCNYRYSLSDMDTNSDSYRVNRNIAMSDSIQSLLEKQD